VDTLRIDLTIIETTSSVLFATCNVCTCTIEYEFGMTRDAAILDLYKTHAHKLKKD
jgi:hypothetical protein